MPVYLSNSMLFRLLAGLRDRSVAGEVSLRATLDAGARPHGAAQCHGFHAFHAQDYLATLAKFAAECLAAEFVGSMINCFLVDVRNAG